MRVPMIGARGIRCASRAGPALLAVLIGASGTGFVFGGLRAASPLSKSHRLGSYQTGGLSESGFEATHVDRSVSEGALLASWTALVSMVVACGLVAWLACPAAYAEEALDPEEIAVLARAELTDAATQRKMAEKQARLNERLAIRKMVEEKKKAEDVVTTNVKAELARISNEKVITTQVANERVRVAREIAIRANQTAEDMSEDKRRTKVMQVDNLGPAKKNLTRALAEKGFADDDLVYRKEFAEKALALQQRANTEASDTKAEVERAVLDLASR